MEDFYSEKGIFIHSEVLNTKCMIDCLQSLYTICPGIRITSVVTDEINNGYKMCFEDFEVRNVLVKRFIKVADGQIYLYPLTTCLLIPDVNQSVNSDFERELTSEICEKYGKVLHLEELQRTTDHPTEVSSTSSFLIQIDVPEIKYLSVFRRNNYPRMFIRVPSICKTFKVKFWCTRCRNQGHTHQECLNNPPKPHTNQEENTGKSATVKLERDAPTPVLPVEIPFQMDTTNSIVECNENNHILPNFIDSRVQKNSTENEEASNTQSCSSVFNCPTDILVVEAEIYDDKHIASGGTASINRSMERKESENTVLPVADSHMSHRNGEDQSSISSKTYPNPAGYNTETSETIEICPAKKPAKTDTVPNPYIKNKLDDNNKETNLQNHDSSLNFAPVATSTTEDDDVLICSDSSSDYVYSQFRGTGNDIPECNRIKEEPTIPAVSEEYPNVGFDVSGLSTGPSTSSPQKKQVLLTKGLSEWLQKCINDSCSELDREHLDLFFIHVKKKVSPIRIAANYTENAHALKEQLKQIKNLYYNSPQFRTKEDVMFMKWLEGLIDRFEGNFISKRKSIAKDGAGTPSKKKA